ncbi:hypothetical protein GGX14DRAFT_645664 [Mycena pura]|uniref:Uncharacterized protein n=1 Tax=Mycena pura TaxID=153505 RepID=A0AAD6YC46_9AGAR|nr:hypothetical protein GGX14DRAFT_645664 [Mycena pura]
MGLQKKTKTKTESENLRRTHTALSRILLVRAATQTDGSHEPARERCTRRSSREQPQYRGTAVRRVRSMERRQRRAGIHARPPRIRSAQRCESMAQRPHTVHVWQDEDAADGHNAASWRVSTLGEQAGRRGVLTQAQYWIILPMANHGKSCQKYNAGVAKAGGLGRNHELRNAGARARKEHRGRAEDKDVKR